MIKPPDHHLQGECKLCSSSLFLQHRFSNNLARRPRRRTSHQKRWEEIRPGWAWRTPPSRPAPWSPSRRGPPCPACTPCPARWTGKSCTGRHSECLQWCRRFHRGLPGILQLWVKLHVESLISCNCSADMQVWHFCDLGFLYLIRCSCPCTWLPSSAINLQPMTKRRERFWSMI